MHLLDNAIWNALNTSQAQLGTGGDVARRFLPEVSLLGGFTSPSDEAYDSLASLVEAGERVGLFLEADPKPPSNWKVVASIPLLQMLHDNGALRNRRAQTARCFISSARTTFRKCSR